MWVKSILLVILLSIPNVAFADSDMSLDFFGTQQIFDVPLANPRSPGDMSFSIDTSMYKRQRVYYFEAIIGRNIPIATLDTGEWKFQFGLEGSAWLTLGYQDGACPLLTEDFLIAAPISFSYKKISGALAFNHISAHMGDGMTILLEEELSDEEQREFELYDELAEEEGLDLSLSDPAPYSRDFMSLYLAYNYNVDGIDSRMYLHGGYVHHMIPEGLGPTFIGTGFEAKYPCEPTTPYYSQDITWNEDNDSVDYSSQLGFYITPREDDLFTVRVALTGFVGYDRRGQFRRSKIKKFGLGIFIR
jgi:hypothetical protein